MNSLIMILGMNSLIMILGLVVVTMSGITMLALRRARQAGARCVNLESLVIDADQRLSDIETQISRLTKTGKETGRYIDRLAAEQGRLVPSMARTGFGEAIALIEHGASAEQLIDTCGISQAEACLVETLYRRKEPKVAVSPNKFELIDAHLEMADQRSES